jgi:hypothetical protein
MASFVYSPCTGVAPLCALIKYTLVTLKKRIIKEIMIDEEMSGNL